MPLSIGARVGPYEVLGVLGAGGMGEVYRARDTRLNRDVAIKVLPAALADNTGRLLRFDREARALAALNHPNIAAIYGTEGLGSVPPTGDARSPGQLTAIVMELVEGEDLSARIRRGPISVAEALPIARQVAEALAAAHEAGIVHRDLKPANIKLRDDGTVKVLDFGLAKGEIVEPGSAVGSGSGPGTGSESLDFPATLTMRDDLTGEGVVLGTAAYMSPEQAKGKGVDKRADIWAFGVVLFEMLAGRRPFANTDGSERPDAADTLAHVLLREPEWSALPPDTPSSIRRLLVRCLTKDRTNRLHDIADARLEIDEAIAPRSTAEWEAGAAGGGAWVQWARPTLVAMLCLLAGAALGVALWRMPPVTPAVTYARLDVGPAVELTAAGTHPYLVLAAGGSRTALAWSPNGRTLAFIGLAGGVRQVYLRDLASDAARPLAGTVGARALAFSPDGEEVAFWADDAIRKVNTAGGPVAKLCSAWTVNGISWGATRILYADSPRVYEVPPSGGDRRPITLPTELVRHASPFLLPGETAVLYTEYEKQWTSGGERVMVLSLAPGAVPRVLLKDAADARYIAAGQIAFLRQGTLFAVPFDARTLELRGEPVAVLKDVAQAVAAWDSDDLTLEGQFALSSQGTLAYVSSPLAAYPDRELITVDRKGRVVPLPGAPAKGYRSHVELSPDGTRLGVSIQSATDIQAFSYDMARGNLSRLAESLTGEVILAAWSRRDQIAVQVIDAGKISAYLVRSNAASPPVPLPDSNAFWATSFSPDGRLAGMRAGDLLIYPAEPQDARPMALKTAPTDSQPVWSPNGLWIAYTSITTGRPEVYVRPFPGSGEGAKVSINGGKSPSWNPKGGELFFIEPGLKRDRMMAVDFAAPDHPGTPEPLFSFPRAELFLGTLVLTPYAVALDGQHFYSVRQLPRLSTPVTQINLVLNWFEVLKAKVPAAK